MTEDEEFEALEQRLNMKETKQPEALRLAEAIEKFGLGEDIAVELRRLHEEVQEQCRINGMGAEREARLMAVNQELVKALKLALEALESCSVGDYSTGHVIHPSFDVDAVNKAIDAVDEALAEQPAQQEQVRVPVTDNTYNYAKSLAEAIFKQHFASDEHYASGRIVWGVNDTVIGILTQIDNMVADMVRRPAQQQEPVAYDKTEINCFAQDLYDQKMREGKRGHYESMFHVIHQCIKKVSPPASKPWVGLTQKDKKEIERLAVYVEGAISLTEAKLKEKNA